MVASALISSSLALSLLKHSSSPSESFVLSPFSFNSALSVLNEGACGETRKELTDVLLQGIEKNASDRDALANELYAALALKYGKHSSKGVSVTSANRFYVDDSITLEKTFKDRIVKGYNSEVLSMKLSESQKAAKEMNDFVSKTTHGKIPEIIKPESISSDAKAIFLNALHFLGKWNRPFNSMSNQNKTFKGVAGDRQVEFMNAAFEQYEYSEESSNKVATVLLIPYENKEFNFFMIMPKEGTSLEKFRNELTGEKLHALIDGAKTDYDIDISIPKMKISSNFDGKNVLFKMGIKTLFENSANLTSITSTPLKLSKFQHSAVIEVNEEGTEAAASTLMEAVPMSLRTELVFDRPFLFGIIADNDILFIGQFV